MKDAGARASRGRRRLEGEHARRRAGPPRRTGAWHRRARACGRVVLASRSPRCDRRGRATGPRPRSSGLSSAAGALAVARGSAVGRRGASWLRCSAKPGSQRSSSRPHGHLGRSSWHSTPIAAQPSPGGSAGTPAAGSACSPAAVRRRARVGDPRELPARIQARVNRNVSARGRLQDRVAGSRAAPRRRASTPGLTKPSSRSPSSTASRVAVQREPQQPADRRRQPVGQPVRPRRSRARRGARRRRSRKLPGCGSACSSPARAGPENRNRSVAAGRPRSRSLGRARRDDPRQRRALDPLGDQHLPAAASTTCGTSEVRSPAYAAANVRWRSPRGRSPAPRATRALQLGDQRLDVHARATSDAEQPRQPADLVEVGQQRLRRRRGTAP